MRADKTATAPLCAAIIEPVGGHGGMNYYDYGLAGGLHTSGVLVSVYTCDETTVPDRAPFRVETVFRGIYGADPKWMRFLRFAKGLARSLRAARARAEVVVHFHFFHATALEALSVGLAALRGFPIVVTAHDVESFSGNSSPRLAAWVYRKARRVIAHNRVIRDELANSAGVALERIDIIPHGNYPAALACHTCRADAKRRLGLPDRGPMLLFFGQIKTVKGLDLLLRALPRVVQDHPTLTLIVAGKVWKDDFLRYDALLRKGGIVDHVDLRIRYIPDDEVSDYYRASDLVVLPYRKIYQSGVLLMAMSYGIPVLASDLEGMAEIVHDGVNGYLFRSEDSDHLAERLSSLLADPDTLGATGRAGREYVRDRHDWGEVGRLTRETYERAAF